MYTFKKGYYADVRIEDRFSTNVRIKNDQLEEAKEKTEKKPVFQAGGNHESS